VGDYSPTCGVQVPKQTIRALEDSAFKQEVPSSRTTLKQLSVGSFKN